jgi:hypothetical protein
MVWRMANKGRKANVGGLMDWVCISRSVQHRVRSRRSRFVTALVRADRAAENVALGGARSCGSKLNLSLDLRLPKSQKQAESIGVRGPVGCNQSESPLSASQPSRCL